MSNLTEAKEELEKGKQLDQILNPQPKQKRIKLPLARDMNLVERILNEKIQAKRTETTNKMLESTKLKYKGEIDALHLVAISLKTAFERLNTKIKAESKQKMEVRDNYVYWSDLPETMNDTKDIDVIKVTDDQPEIDQLRKEIDAHVLDIKLGLSPLSDVKLLLTKIDQLK